MIILGVDFETNGLDVKEAHITEIGAVLFDSDLGGPIESLSCFLHDSSYPPQPQNILDLTGITDEMLKREGVLPKVGLQNLARMMLKADYCMAHNKKFDSQILQYFAAKNNYDMIMPIKPWLCSLTEIEWPKSITCRKLSHIALELSPDLLFKDGKRIELHRALNDVELMLGVVHKNFKWEEVVAYAMQSWVTLQVLIPKPWTDNGIGKDWAKKNGYGWERPPGSDLEYPQSWVKRIKESKVSGEQNDKPYEIRRV